MGRKNSCQMSGLSGGCNQETEAVLFGTGSKFTSLGWCSVGRQYADLIGNLKGL